MSRKILISIAGINCNHGKFDDQRIVKKKLPSEMIMANVEALSVDEISQKCDTYCKLCFGYVCYLNTSAGQVSQFIVMKWQHGIIGDNSNFSDIFLI